MVYLLEVSSTNDVGYVGQKDENVPTISSQLVQSFWSSSHSGHLSR